MEYSRSILLSIAGADPSGGAGLLADVKTFEQHRCLGFAAVTAITAQTENTFLNAVWLPLQMVVDQCEPLLEKYKIDVVKIGVVESLDFMLELVHYIKSKNPNVKIIWDTVLKPSAGGEFISSIDDIVLENILQQVYLITPNSLEVCRLAGVKEAKQAAALLSRYCNVYLKGGHLAEDKGTDFLYQKSTALAFLPSHNNLPQKHGSGCILSSAIAANIALGSGLETACREAKQYIEIILNSNPNLLAYHVQ